MNFSMIILIQGMEIEQNFVTQILIALLFTLKPKIFLKMLRDGLIHLMIKKMIQDLYQ